MVNCPICSTLVELDRCGGKPCYENHNSQGQHCIGSIQPFDDGPVTSPGYDHAAGYHD